MPEAARPARRPAPSAPPLPVDCPAVCPVICLGAAHWDVIGRTAVAPDPGADLPGRVIRRPGGVALNIAAALARRGVAVELVAAIGRDPEGRALAAAARALGIGLRGLRRERAQPTGAYVAVEGPGGLVAAVADTGAIEAAGEALLAPLADGRLGSAAAPFAGVAVVDGNLAPGLLAGLAVSPLLARAAVWLAPASPARAARLAPFLGHPRAVFCLNLAEAGALAGAPFATAAAAAEALVAAGARRAIVTDGPGPCAEAAAGEALRAAAPPALAARRVTGAGDVLLAARLAAGLAGAPPAAALAAAVAAASAHVAEADPGAPACPSARAALPGEIRR